MQYAVREREKKTNEYENSVVSYKVIIMHADSDTYIVVRRTGGITFRKYFVVICLSLRV